MPRLQRVPTEKKHTCPVRVHKDLCPHSHKPLDWIITSVCQHCGGQHRQVAWKLERWVSLEGSVSSGQGVLGAYLLEDGGGFGWGGGH